MSQAVLSEPNDTDAHFTAEHIAEFDARQIAALGRIVHGSNRPCLVFDKRCKILVANAQAEALFDAKSGGQLTNLAIESADKTAVNQQLKTLFRSGDIADALRVMRVHSTRKSRAFTIALTLTDPDINGMKFVVAHAVDLVGDATFKTHIARTYDLTNSETAVLEQFMSGQTLEQIATLRRRSVATIKKQFYALIAKFNVKSQAELLQFLYSLSQVFDAAGSIERIERHPHRQEATVLRPHGRVVEVILAGDLKGTPVVVLPTLFQRCFPMRIEHQLKDAGILTITVVPPGRGKTSGHLPEACERTCWVDDIAAVLDQLSIERAMLFGTDDMLRMGVMIAKQIPHRLTQILVTAPVLPTSYEKGADHRDNLIPFSKKMQLVTPSLRKLSLRMFWRSLTMLHAKGMAHIFLRNDPADLRSCLDPDTLAELQAAFDSVLTAGFERGSNHHMSTFDDWHKLIADCPVPITIYEGSKSRLCNREMLKQFVADHSEVVTLVEFETSGTSFPYVRPDLMIKMIDACSSNTKTVN